MALSKPAVSGSAIESSSKALLAEWLAAWFDGQSHAAGTNAAMVFPKADIVFDQGGNEQPKGGAEIRVLCEPGEEFSKDTDDGRSYRMDVVLVFGIKSKVQTEAGKNSKSLTQEVSERLFFLLKHPLATQDLARKGISKFRPKKAKVMRDELFYSAVILCRARLTYAIKF